MNAKRWLAILGTAGAALAATGCQDSQVRKWIEGREGTEGLYNYLRFLNESVCQLEQQNPNGLDPAKRICPDPPIEKKTVPTYPP
jgi:hypothetical protein